MFNTLKFVLLHKIYKPSKTYDLMDKEKTTSQEESEERASEEPIKETRKERRKKVVKPKGKKLTTFSKKEKKKPKTLLGKIWYFIWEDNSVWSWLANIVIAFVLIKFVVYPVLGGMFGTGLPIVAVVSGSMEHKLSTHYDPSLGKIMLYETICGKFPTDYKGGFDEYWRVCGAWYEEKNITKSMFRDFPMHNGFNKGDIIILFGAKPENIAVGDIIVFQSGRQYPIIHRVVEKRNTGSQYVFQTKGDHNPDSVKDIRNNIPVLDEFNISERYVIGKAVFKIPLLGWLKIWFVDLMKLTGIYYLFV